MSEQQSPVLRFGLPAIAVMIAFGLWSSLLGPVASEMHMNADRIESDAKRLSDGADLAVRLGRAERKDRNATGDLIVAFGELAAPPNENEAGSSLLALINDIREEFGNAIREDTFRQGVGRHDSQNRSPTHAWTRRCCATGHRGIPICGHH